MIKCSSDWCGCVVLIWRPVNLSMIYSWVREFLNDENRGLDILVEYLSFAQCAVMWVPLHTLVIHWCFQKLLGWAADPAAELTCVPWSWGARNACASKRGVNCTLVSGCPAVSEWSVFLDGCCVVQLSFIMQLDDSFCDKRLALSQAASLTYPPPMPLILLVCLPICLPVCLVQVWFWGLGEWGGGLLGQV